MTNDPLRIKDSLPTFNAPSLERKLTRVQRDILRMGALVENSCLLAKEALCDRNLDAAKKLKTHDKHIDQLYRQIELDCVNLLNLEAPITQDLRLVSAFMQMIRDLERIGDYAKDIGEVALKLFPYPVHDCMGQIQVMIDRCRSMVALCLMSLAELNAETGYVIKEKDDVVDDDYERIYAQLVQTPIAAPTMEPVVLLVLVIRYLERIADHATNIGRRVFYIVTGEREFSTSRAIEERQSPEDKNVASTIFKKRVSTAEVAEIDQKSLTNLDLQTVKIVSNIGLEISKEIMLNQAFDVLVKAQIECLIDANDTGENFPYSTELKIVLRTHGFKYDNENLRTARLKQNEIAISSFQLTPQHVGQQEIRLDIYQFERRIGTIRETVLVKELYQAQI